MTVTAGKVSLRQAPATAQDQEKQKAAESEAEQQQPAKKRKIARDSSVAVPVEAKDAIALADQSAANTNGRQIGSPASVGQTKGSKATAKQQKRKVATISPDHGAQGSVQEQEETGKAAKAKQKTKSQAGTKDKKDTAAVGQTSTDKGGTTEGGAETEEIMPLIQEEKTWAESRNRKDIKHGT